MDEHSVSSVFRDDWAETVRLKLAEIGELNDQLADVHADNLLRHCQRLERAITGWRDLADRRVYKRDRELIGDLFELLDDQVEAFRKFSLMLTPRRERA